jgi:hypothetical protein
VGRADGSGELPDVARRRDVRRAAADGVRAERPTTLVTRITDKSLPFGGRWEYRVAGEGGGSRVRITEHGEVYNPVFRFVSRFIMGHTATASAYLKALGARFGATVTPEG